MNLSVPTVVSNHVADVEKCHRISKNSDPLAPLEEKPADEQGFIPK